MSIFGKKDKLVNDNIEPQQPQQPVPDHNCNNCCPGPMGPMGLQGPQGPQGIQGMQGLPGKDGKDGLNGKDGKDGKDGLDGKDGKDGKDGLNGKDGKDGKDGLDGLPGKNGQDGPQGPQGLQGVPGQQGLQGPKGDCVECPCECDDVEYLQVYSQKNQNLAASPGLNLPGDPVLFEKIQVVTANIDVTNVNINGAIMINKAGWYRVEKEICATLNPLSAPLIAWGMALFKNGVIIDGTTFVDMTLSPDQQANETSATFLMHFDKGDVLKLHNMTNQNLLLNAVINGVNCPINSASLNIQSVKFD